MHNMNFNHVIRGYTRSFALSLTNIPNRIYLIFTVLNISNLWLLTQLNRIYIQNIRKGLYIVV